MFDDTKPTVTAPPDLVLDCPADTRTNVTGVATVRDDCDFVSVAFEDVIANNCGGTKVIARTWTGTDTCGNSSSAVQTITVRDTTGPVLSVPANRELECPADTQPSATGMATARDTCGTATVSFTDNITEVCAGAKVIARTWTAVDECGNSSSGVQTITVRDTRKPVLTLPVDLVLDCPADTATTATGVATATDECSNVSISYNDVVSTNCGATKVIARTWTVVDECNNSSTGVQTITVRDIGIPALTCPPDLTLNCPADTGTNATGVATAEDACSKTTISYKDVVTSNCGPTKVIARTWTATDECGNVVSATQRITVQDNVKPLITCPADITLECPADTSTSATGIATAEDTCSATTVTFTDAVTENCGATKVVARTWTATDECGNSSSAVQTITVLDRVKPVLIVPVDVVLECPAEPITGVTGMATASDACSQVTVTYNDSFTDGCGNTRVIARTWTVTDECGNSTSAVQQIVIRDTVKPVISVPADVVLECPANTTPANTGTATGTDTCGQVTITFRDATTASCGATKVIVRTWTVTDECGNASSGVQSITVQDTTPPVLSGYPTENPTVQCYASLPAARV